MALWYEGDKTYSPMQSEDIRQAIVSVTTASTELAKAKKRTSFYILNQSTAGANITISFGERAAVASTGIMIPPGYAYYESNDAGFTCWQGKICAISTATTNVCIVER